MVKQGTSEGPVHRADPMHKLRLKPPTKAASYKSPTSTTPPNNTSIQERKINKGAEYHL